MNCNKIYTDKKFNIIVSEDFDQEYVYVYILQHPNKNIPDNIIIKENSEQEVKFKTFSDGCYGLITLIVPIDPINYYYYREGKFYHNFQEVELVEIIECNPNISNVVSIYDYYFLTARLRRCYIDACQKIFESSTKCDKDSNKELLYKRDLVWSALNVIEYLVEFKQYEEAQRLLEELMDCNGICQSYNNQQCCCHHE